MEIEYRYFAKIWSGRCHATGNCDYLLLEARDYDAALIEIREIDNLDYFKPLSYLPTDAKTHRWLSQWEMENRKK